MMLYIFYTLWICSVDAGVDIIDATVGDSDVEVAGFLLKCLKVNLLFASSVISLFSAGCV